MTFKIPKFLQLSPPQKTVLKIHFIILIGYILACGFYYFYHHELREIVERNSNKNIADSFSASVAFTLFIFIFGLIISFITVISTINDPKNETFETRVKALANSEKIDVDDELYSFLRQHLGQTLAFNKSTDIYIEIQDYNLKKNAFRVYCEVRTITSNMCKDNDYYTAATKISVKPDVDVEGDWGTLVHLTLLDPHNGIPIEHYHNSQQIDKEFYEEKEVAIPKNEEIGWMFSYVIWNQIGDFSKELEWYFFKFHRYTRSYKVRVKNKLKTKESVKLDIRKSKYYEKNGGDIDNSQKFSDICAEKELKYDETLVRESAKLDFYPNDTLQFFFKF